MNKDAILATLIGFGIGLVITSILLFGPSVAKSLAGIQLPALQFNFGSPKQNDQSASDITPTEAPGSSSQLFGIDSPIAESIVNDSDLPISGVARAQTIVVMAGPKGEEVVTVGQDGSFTGTLALVEGKNEIAVTAIEKGTAVTKNVIVYYTPEKL